MRSLDSLPAGTVVGGFVVIERSEFVVAGAVYLAYDPELDRTVNVRVFAGDDGATAEAFARVSHAGLAAVHRSGVYGELEWVALAGLAGVRLGELGPHPLSVRAIVEMFVAAGRALSALHAAGLVHGGISAGHIAVQADGQVAVDIAPASRCAEDDGPTVGSDVRDFFGALRDVVSVAGPRRAAASRWLRSVCERGVAGGFDDMAQAVAALQAGLRRARRRSEVIAAGGVAAVGVVALVASRAHEASLRAACEEQGASVEAIWNDAIREQLSASILAAEVPFAETTVAKFGARLDAYTDQWREAQTQACIDARVERTLGADTAERIGWCLADRRRALAALLDALFGAEDSKAAASAAVPATVRLEDPLACADPRRESTLPATPPLGHRPQIADIEATLAAAGGLRAARQTAAALATARSARIAAEPLGWAPLLARALDAEVSSLIDTGDLARAKATALRAYELAFSVREWRTATSAASRLVYLETETDAGPDAVLAWAEQSALVAELAGGADGIAAAHVKVMVGGALEQLGRFDDAEAKLREGLELRRNRLGEDHPSVVDAERRLATVLRSLGKFDEAQPLLERALQLQRDLLGEDHPAVGDTMWSLAGSAEVQLDFPATRDWALQALAILEPALGSQHPRIGELVRKVGLAYFGAAEFEPAERYLVRALKITQATTAAGSTAEGTALRALGRLRAHQRRHAEAETLFLRAAEIYRSHGTANRPELAGVYSELGDLRGSRGDERGRLRAYEQEIEINTSVYGADHFRVAMGVAYRGFAKLKLGDIPGAHADVTRGLAILERTLDKDHPWIAMVLPILADIEVERDDLDAAEKAGWRAVAILERTMGEDSHKLGTPLISLADTIDARGEPKRALETVRRALSILDAVEGTQLNESYGHWRMAVLLDQTGGDRNEARRHAQIAREGWLEVGRTEKAAEATQWLEAHR